MKTLRIIALCCLALLVISIPVAHSQLKSPEVILFGEWKDSVNVTYTEKFWNWSADCSNMVEDSPQYKWLLEYFYENNYAPVATAQFIESLYRANYDRCLDSIDGTDSECDSCFVKVFGAN